MWFLLNLIHSRTGRALRAIASSEIAANSLGVNPFRYKLIVFVLTAAMAGFAGSLYVHSNQYALARDLRLFGLGAAGGDGRARRMGTILGRRLWRRDFHRRTGAPAQSA